MQDHLHARHAFLDSQESTPDVSNHRGVRLSHLLGAGRHGLVFLGVRDDSATPDKVAVKVPNHPAGLEKEGKALRRFTHPGIVELIDGPLSNGALILEHCDLGTLADRLADGTLAVDEAQTLARALVPALQHLHDQGWIHGDISPGNIGLRTQRGPVLLDFATARPADGQAVSEGTAEFAGPLRQADPRLDVRALAATLLAAIGSPDRWDHRKRSSVDQLETLIERCDNDDPIDLREIIDLLDGHTSSAAQAGVSGGGPFVTTSTRAFGPSPTAPAIAEPQTGDQWRRTVLLVAVGLTAIAIAAEVSFGAFRSPGQPDALRLVEERRAVETLVDAGADWDEGTGVLTTTVGGSVRSLSAGEPGDLAAIADWDCDGDPTLGVFRPSTGAWFVFDSWTDHSVARATHVGTGTTLTIRNDDHGCATPVVRSVSEPDR